MLIIKEQERLRAEHGELKELLDALSEQLKADFQSVTDAEDVSFILTFSYKYNN